VPGWRGLRAARRCPCSLGPPVLGRGPGPARSLRRASHSLPLPQAVTRSSFRFWRSRSLPARSAPGRPSCSIAPLAGRSPRAGRRRAVPVRAASAPVAAPRLIAPPARARRARVRARRSGRGCVEKEKAVAPGCGGAAEPAAAGRKRVSALLLLRGGGVYVASFHPCALSPFRLSGPLLYRTPRPSCPAEPISFR
jgi:hypothetical protein